VGFGASLEFNMRSQQKTLAAVLNVLRDGPGRAFEYERNPGEQVAHFYSSCKKGEFDVEIAIRSDELLQIYNRRTVCSLPDLANKLEDNLLSSLNKTQDEFQTFVLSQGVTARDKPICTRLAFLYGDHEPTGRTRQYVRIEFVGDCADVAKLFNELCTHN